MSAPFSSLRRRFQSAATQLSSSIAPVATLLVWRDEIGPPFVTRTRARIFLLIRVPPSPVHRKHEHKRDGASGYCEDQNAVVCKKHGIQRVPPMKLTE